MTKPCIKIISPGGSVESTLTSDDCVQFNLKDGTVFLIGFNPGDKSLEVKTVSGDLISIHPETNCCVTLRRSR